MTTFSRLIDDVVTELLRPDMVQTAASYANQTIREMHFRPTTSSPVLYDANRIEDTIAIMSEGTWLWSIPFANRFQDVEALYHNDYGLYIPRKNPRQALEFSFEPHAGLYWYRSGPQLAIAGVGTGQTAKISYFIYPQTLAYKPVTGTGTRKIAYDPDSDVYRLIVDGGVPSQAELDAETHWILQRWGDTVKQGVRAKLWGRLGEMERSRLAYSAFETARTIVWNAEPSS